MTNKPLWYAAAALKTIGFLVIVFGELPDIGGLLMLSGWYLISYHGYREVWMRDREIEVYHDCLDRATTIWRKRNPDSEIDIPDGAEAFRAALDELKERRS